MLPPILQKDRQAQAERMSVVDAKIEEIIRKSLLRAELISKHNEQQRAAANVMDTSDDQTSPIQSSMLLNTKGKLVTSYCQDDFRVPLDDVYRHDTRQSESATPTPSSSPAPMPLAPVANAPAKAQHKPSPTVASAPPGQHSMIRQRSNSFSDFSSLAYGRDEMAID